MSKYYIQKFENLQLTNTYLTRSTTAAAADVARCAVPDTSFAPETGWLLVIKKHTTFGYYLSALEIHSVNYKQQAYSMDKEISFNERALLSSVEVQDQAATITPTLGQHLPVRMALKLVVVKPMTASNAAAEEDSIRVLESLKKLLNMRVKYARSTRELQTFEIMINGDKVQLSRMELTEDGRYVSSMLPNVVLGTTTQTKLQCNLTLVALISFLHLMEESVIGEDELGLLLLFNQYSQFIKSTVYVLKSDDDA